MSWFCNHTMDDPIFLYPWLFILWQEKNHVVLAMILVIYGSFSIYCWYESPVIHVLFSMHIISP